MRAPSIRLAIMASLTFLILWIGSALVGAVAALAGAVDVADVLDSDAWTILLPALGFIGLMIFGMAQQFVPLYSGRNLWSPRTALVQVAWGISGVVLVLLGPSFEPYGLALWLASVVLFFAILIMTLRTEPMPTRPQGRRPEFAIMDRYGIPMTSAAILYLAAASVGLLLASPTDGPLVPWASLHWFSFLHLYTLGFIALMVFGVGFHLLPRFLDVAPRLGVARAIVVLALPGPLLVALTMPFLGTSDLWFLFAFFAILEAAAAVLFAALVLDVWRRSEHRRPASTFNAAAGLWLILGVALAALFGLDAQDTLAWVPVHGWVNLLGFAGFEIFGVTHEVLPPFTSKGLAVSRRVTRVDFVLAVLGLALVVASYAASLGGFPFDGGVLAVLGFAVLLAMALLYAYGTVWSLLGVVRRPRPQ